MKFKFSNKYVSWGLTAFLVIAASIVFYYFMFHRSNIVAGFNTLTGILMPVVIGLVAAYLMIPVLNFIEKKALIPLFDKCSIKATKKRASAIRSISILITACLFIAMIYLMFYMLISQLVPSIQNIIENFDGYIDNTQKWVNKTLEDNPEVSSYILGVIEQFSDQLDQLLNELPSKIMGLIGPESSTASSIFDTVYAVTANILGKASNVLGVLLNIIIGFIISIYVMASKEKFAAQSKKMAYALFERNTANLAIRTFRFTHKTFIGFLGGKIIDSIIIGILCFIGTSLLRTPYAALVSMIIGVTNVIPFFGPYLGAIPSAILILIVDPMHPLNCVYFVIFILVLQQFDGNILGPKILGDSTGLTSFWVIFAITFFGGLYGILGMIVGVPIFAVIYAGIKTMTNSMLMKKQMPTETEKYEKLEYVDEKGFHEYQTVPNEKRQSHKTLGRQADKPENTSEADGPDAMYKNEFGNDDTVKGGPLRKNDGGLKSHEVSDSESK